MRGAGHAVFGDDIQRRFDDPLSAFRIFPLRPAAHGTPFAKHMYICTHCPSAGVAPLS
jgi:hypothetical protein